MSILPAADRAALAGLGAPLVASFDAVAREAARASVAVARLASSAAALPAVCEPAATLADRLDADIARALLHPARLADARREVERVDAASGDALVATQSLRADNGRAIVTHSTPNRAQRRAKARR